jgi:hypothetical protein
VLIRRLTDSHLLIWPGALANPSQIMQKLSQRTANFILRNLRENLAFPWCRKVLKRFALPPTVHDHAHYRVLGRRGYDMNIWSEKEVAQTSCFPRSAAFLVGTWEEPQTCKRRRSGLPTICTITQ